MSFIFIQMSQKLHFIVDTFTSEDETVQCPNTSFCNCGRDSCCEEGCECGCVSASCNCCAGSVKYDTVYCDLPPNFVQSRNPNKNISILLVRLFDLTSNQEIIGSLHSDIVRIDSSADHYVCATNLLYVPPKQYVCPDNKKSFECWFRKVNGDIVDLERTKTRFVCEMLLEF